jgi:hypothetical protein
MMKVFRIQLEQCGHIQYTFEKPPTANMPFLYYCEDCDCERRIRQVDDKSLKDMIMMISDNNNNKNNNNND